MAESRDGITDSGVLATLSELDRVRSKLSYKDHWKFSKLSMLDTMMSHLEHRIILLAKHDTCNCASCGETRRQYIHES